MKIFLYFIDKFFVPIMSPVTHIEVLCKTRTILNYFTMWP